jgi:hypothetical protein
MHTIYFIKLPENAEKKINTLYKLIEKEPLNFAALFYDCEGC